MFQKTLETLCYIYIYISSSAKINIWCFDHTYMWDWLLNGGHLKSWRISHVKWYVWWIWHIVTNAHTKSTMCEWINRSMVSSHLPILKSGYNWTYIYNYYFMYNYWKMLETCFLINIFFLTNYFWLVEIHTWVPQFWEQVTQNKAWDLHNIYIRPTSWIFIWSYKMCLKMYVRVHWWYVPYVFSLLIVSRNIKINFF